MSSSAESALAIERRDGIVTLTLNRPQRRNAIDVPLWHALAQALSEIAMRSEDRAVVLTGAEGTFCAGGDLSGADTAGGGDLSGADTAGGGDPSGADTAGGGDLSGADTAGGGADPVEGAVRAMRESVGAACLALHRLPKPSLAAVEGTAAGAGANLAFGCDLVLAGASARFGEVFIRRALPVDSGGSWLLPRLVGLQTAKRLAFFGDWIGAEEAKGIGLVSQVVPDGECLARAQEWAARLAGASAPALAWIKRNLNLSLGVDLETCLEDEARALAECVATPEFAEALRSFLGPRRS